MMMRVCDNCRKELEKEQCYHFECQLEDYDSGDICGDKEIGNMDFCPNCRKAVVDIIKMGYDKQIRMMSLLAHYESQGNEAAAEPLAKPEEMGAAIKPKRKYTRHKKTDKEAPQDEEPAKAAVQTQEADKAEAQPGKPRCVDKGKIRKLYSTHSLTMSEIARQTGASEEEVHSVALEARRENIGR